MDEINNAMIVSDEQNKMKPQFSNKYVKNDPVK